MNIAEKDWKLFRKRVPVWQEQYMERLIEKYSEYLGSDAAASDRFWGLREMIDDDRKSPGVTLRLARSEMESDLVMMILNDVISVDDLDGFSDELAERVRFQAEYWLGDMWEEP